MLTARLLATALALTLAACARTTPDASNPDPTVPDAVAPGIETEVDGGSAPAGRIVLSPDRAADGIGALETSEPVSFTNGGGRVSDPAATNGLTVLLPQTSSSVRFRLPAGLPAGTYTVRARARGVNDGGWPVVRLNLNGTQVVTNEIETSTYGIHTFGNYSLTAGQTLEVMHTNGPASGAGAGRDPRVDYLILDPVGATAPTPVSGTRVVLEPMSFSYHAGRVGDSNATNGLTVLLPDTSSTVRYVVPASLAAGKYAVRVVGRGVNDGGWPVVRLSVNGRPESNNEIETSSYAEHLFGTYELAAGQMLEVAHTNGSRDGTGALRDPYLDYMILERVTTSTPNTPASGSLDASFGGDGVVLTDLGAFGEHVRAAVVQPDGKVVVLVATQEREGGGGGFLLARYNHDGTTDLSFGTGGQTEVPFDARDIALAPSGAIAVAGSVSDRYGATSPIEVQRVSPLTHDETLLLAVARFRPDGSPDASFGQGGWTAIRFGPADDERGDVGEARVIVQPDGRVLVGGRLRLEAVDDAAVALARLLPDGRLDASFGGDGRVVTNTFPRLGGDETVADLALQADGRILLVPGGLTFTVVRYRPDGSLDPAFGGDGRVTVDFGATEEGAGELAVRPDGRIVVAGGYQNYQPYSGGRALAFLNADGSLDTSVSEDGRVTIAHTDVTTPGEFMELQADGKIVLAGTVGTGENDYHLMRLLPDGRLDTAFGSDGTVTTNIETGTERDSGDVVSGMVLHDGKILLVGGTMLQEGAFPWPSHGVLARYHQ